MIPVSHFSTVSALTLAAASAGMMLAASPAYAETRYLLQLGTTASAQEADTLYRELQEKHSSVLSRYTYIPRETVSIADGTPSWRVQVGLLDSRAQAYKACNEIRTQGDDCFVVETAALSEDMIARAAPRPRAPITASGETETADASSTAADTPLLPWLSRMFETDTQTQVPVEEAALAPAADARTNINTVSVAAQPAEQEEGAFDLATLPWLQGGSSASSEPETADQHAEVEVAEAIPVPLSQAQEEAPPAAPEPATAPPPPARETVSVSTKRTPAPASLQASRNAYWLQIGPFSTRSVAEQCWQLVQDHDASFAALNMRTVNIGNEGEVALRVGPLSTRDHASIACGLAKRCDVGGLSCSGIAEIPSASQKLKSSPATPRDYRMYRQQPRTPRAASAPSASSSGAYWVQFGSFRTRGSAEQRWQQLQNAHRPQLKGHTPQISAASVSSTSLAKNTFRLRTGPFATRDAAQTLCAGLSAQGESCLVLAE